MKTDKILITGATGYIGSSLISQLKGEEYRVIALTRQDKCRELNVETRRIDWNDQKLLYESVSDADIVIHLAGIKGHEKFMKEIARFG